MRLNKFLASFAGYSRRDADEVIKQGRVSVNGEVVANLATFVKEKDEVSLDGAIISTKAKNVYLLLHKIKGYVTTTEDDKGRKTVLDLVKEPLITCACNKCKGLTAVDIKSARIYPIGRLDYDTEGLLLLTNDGDLSYRLTHPSLEIPKTYIAKLEGEIVESQLATLRKGVALDGVKTKPAKVKLLEFRDGVSRVQITITEGKNRQVKRMFEEVGKKVVYLKRIQIGQLKLGSLTRGHSRFLTHGEIEYLKKL